MTRPVGLHGNNSTPEFNTLNGLHDSRDRKESTATLTSITTFFKVVVVVVVVVPMHCVIAVYPYFLAQDDTAFLSGIC